MDIRTNICHSELKLRTKQQQVLHN